MLTLPSVTGGIGEFKDTLHAVFFAEDRSAVDVLCGITFKGHCQWQSSIDNRKIPFNVPQYVLAYILSFLQYYRVAQKNVPNFAYTLWGEISFGTFVDQYVMLLTYKFQWRH